MSEIREDFEVKRFVLGLTAFLVNSDMPDSVKNNYPKTCVVRDRLEEERVDKEGFAEEANPFFFRRLVLSGTTPRC
mgnify:CR=1 FL=1